jgi:hypothetical protein
MKNAYVILLVLLFIFSLGLFAQSRGGALELNVTMGKMWVIVISSDKYQEWEQLDNPVRDGRKILKVLQDHYIVDEWLELSNEKASAEGIRKLFEELSRNVGIYDSVCVIHMGHGIKDKITNKGYWLPYDAGRNSMRKERWIGHDEIITFLDKLPAHSILLISDSCHSGELLTVERGGVPPMVGIPYVNRASSFMSRQVITSGADEKVPDTSEFAQLLENAFLKNEYDWIDSLRLYDQVRQVKATQPRYGVMPGSLHQQGGSFFFFRKSAASPPPPIERQTLSANRTTPTAVVHFTGTDLKQIEKDTLTEDLQRALGIYGISIEIVSSDEALSNTAYNFLVSLRVNQRPSQITGDLSLSFRKGNRVLKQSKRHTFNQITIEYIIRRSGDIIRNEGEFFRSLPEVIARQ